MSGPAEVPAAFSPVMTSRGCCPVWCSTRHGANLGEEDWVHVGEPLPIAEGTLAQLCMSTDPLTGGEDGPYVLIGSAEYTLRQAELLGRALLTLASVGADRVSAG